MALRINRRLIVLLVLLAASFAGYRYVEYRKQFERIELAQVAYELGTQLSTRTPPTISLAPDFARNFWGFVNGTQTSSAELADDPWIRGNRDLALATLKQNKYAYIVLPIQEGTPSMDRTSRMMSAWWVARSLHKVTGKPVMSPELALRAIGAGSILLNFSAVKSLAKDNGSDVIYLLYKRTPVMTGQPGMGGTMVALLTSANGLIKAQHSYDIQDVSPERPIEMAMAGMADKIVLELLNQSAKPDTVNGTDEPASFALPENLSQLPSGATTPIENAAYLQLLALLTPQTMTFDRRRLFERSMVALKDARPSDSGYNLLMARALFHLYRRPAALRYLEHPASAAEQAMLEYLNGNYPEFKSLLGQITPQVLHACAYIELRELGYAYQQEPLDDNVLSTYSTAWRAVIENAGRDSDPWYAPSNAQLAGALQGLRPSFDSRLSSALGGAVVTGNAAAYNDNAKFFSLAFSGPMGGEANACCADFTQQLRPADVALFFRDLFIGNMLRSLNRDIYVYGSYGDGQKYAESIAPLLDGNPGFLSLYSTVLLRSADASDGEIRAGLLRKSKELAERAMLNASEVDENVMRAGDTLSKVIPLLAAMNQPAKERRFDWTFGDQPTSFMLGSATKDNFINLLEFTNDNLQLLVMATQFAAVPDSVIDHELATRFNGHPIKTLFVFERLMAAGKHDEATHVLQEAVNRGDTTWRVYSLLAQQHVRAGDYGGAQKIFLSYPYFNKIPDDRQVDVSNYAKDAAQTLYEAGSYEEAKPLYRIAAGLKTGAGSQLSAAQHLAQLDGDIRTAAALAYQRSVRYRSGKAYGDYLVYLHLLGFHDEADAGFKAVASQFDSASLWNAPFVGQRMRGLSLSDIAKWSDAYVRSDGKAEERQIDLQSLATRYVFAQALVDRKPAGKALELVAGVAGNGTKRALTRKHELQDVFAHVSATIDCTRNIAACGGDPKNGYRYSLDRYAGFLDAYVLLERERYEESLAAFAAFDASYAMFRMETGRYALPYVALAAVKAGHKDENAVFVNMLTTCCTDDPYYALLAESVIDGAQHRTNDAYEKLVAAFHEGSTDDAPIGAWYEITDISERLYGMTHDKRFLATALAWAKKHQVIRPQAGWAYAFEARYGTTEADRIRGAAFAQYLDPQSRWLAQVPASIRERGKRWWARNNPYTAAGSKSASAI